MSLCFKIFKDLNQFCILSTHSRNSVCTRKEGRKKGGERGRKEGRNTNYKQTLRIPRGLKNDYNIFPDSTNGVTGKKTTSKTKGLAKLWICWYFEYLHI